MESEDVSAYILHNFVLDDFVIVKMDIEGAEFHVIPKMIDDGSIHLVVIAYPHHVNIPRSHVLFSMPSSSVGTPHAAFQGPNTQTSPSKTHVRSCAYTHNGRGLSHMGTPHRVGTWASGMQGAVGSRMQAGYPRGSIGGSVCALHGDTPVPIGLP